MLCQRVARQVLAKGVIADKRYVATSMIPPIAIVTFHSTIIGFAQDSQRRGVAVIDELYSGSTLWEQDRLPGVVET